MSSYPAYRKPRLHSIIGGEELGQMAVRPLHPGVQLLWEQLEDEEEATVIERRRLQDVWKEINAMHKANAEARESLEKRAALNFIDGDERVHLNVGGHVFETTARVLCRDRFSLLACMCKTTPPVAKDTRGVYFIDRDWWIFRYILEFLRNGNLPDEKALLQEMYDEAAFYRLNSLRRAIQRRGATAAVADRITQSNRARGTATPRGNHPSTTAYTPVADTDEEQSVPRTYSYYREPLPDPYGFGKR